MKVEKKKKILIIVGSILTIVTIVLYNINKILKFAEKTPWIANIIILTLLLSIFGLLYYEERSKRKALLNILNKDQLTGVLSENRFVEETRKVLKDNPQKKYSLISVDIDNFKYMNERYGYETGSQVLQIFAEYLKDFAQVPRLLGRGFGDNFFALVETEGVEAEIKQAMEVESVIIGKIETLLADNYKWGFSVGMYDIENPKLDINYMLDCTNFAREKGKKTVGRTFYKFTEEMLKERANRNLILSQMENAIVNKEFVLYYQPKVDLNTLQIVGAEALIRWLKDGELVPPNHFIPVFETSGFIETLDDYVVEEVCKFIEKNKEISVPKISLNISSITMLRLDLVEQLVNIVQKHGVSPEQLDLEITESAFVDGFDEAISRIDTLRALKFTISIDDFGTGISTLHRLKDIEADILKIDRAFIVDALENDKGKTIIKNIISMSKELEIMTVAEGIETREQLELLKELQCDVGQGYYFSRPMPEADFVKSLLLRKK